jgi:hypothetical protein
VDLKWKDLGEGEYIAQDEAGRVLVRVMELNLDPARRFYWYLELPDSPEEGIEPSFFDKYELLYGSAPEGCTASLEEAKVAAEKAMPTPDAEVDAAWAEKGMRDAESNS